ncbi:MAG TPA: ABC transporter ATP-binding protein [Actinotalea caeni]|uniref:dipeptide ABC transporter ATP-binding protein n=1 Tax=Actinotalea caeni TaxID=1348467 RepID=UPI0012E194BB|nr:ABC transporter ATP-binding protein [Actinotalea caeni]HLV55198.1 ABC transporter ATP-binding protein [Actinotalea caeni]
MSAQDDAVTTPRDDEAPALLQVRDLEVTFTTDAGPVVAVSGVSFDVRAGQTVAIVGESGSGKSTVAAAVLGLLPRNGRVTAGSVTLDGQSLLGLSQRRLQRLRGRVLGLVPQDPMTNLNPTATIGRQLVETLEDTGTASGKEARDRAVELLTEAGIGQAEERIAAYPHQFSGGMRQRALIAIGLSASPELLVADEPTSALDVTVQQVVLDRMEQLTAARGTAVMLITHDLGLAADRASDVLVMYRGELVESGPALTLLREPTHEYTKRLLAAAPSLASRRIEIAKQTGAEDAVEGDDLLARTDGHETGTDEPPLIRVENLRKVFPGARRGLFGREPDVVAVDDVSFDMPRGRTVAIVGESGSGKSTVARMLLHLLEPTSGRVLLEGQEVDARRQADEIAFRRRVQPVFQDPYSSLDPLFTVFRTIEEPLRAHGYGDARTRSQRVYELLDQVALPAAMARRYPAELSGGQRQRVAIARALALQPDVVVCDEAVSALDVIVQSQILHLLADLQERLGLTYLFISHDLAVVRQIADHTCVMEKGRIVEQGPTDVVFDSPEEPYTQRLLAAIPGRSLELSL